MPIHITHEELAFLSRLIGNPHLRGLPLELSDDPAQTAALLTAAEASLRARGWVRQNEDVISIEKTVLDAVVFLATAPLVFGIRRTPLGGATISHLFYLAPTLKLHLYTDDGVYIIDAYTSEGFDAAMYAVRGVDATISDRIRYPLSQIPLQGFVGLTALAQMKDASREDVLAGLTAQNLNFEGAGTLFDLYRETWRATVNLSAWMGVDAEIDATRSTLTLLDTRQGWWQITQPTPDSVEVQPLAEYQVTGLVDAILEQTFDKSKG